MRHYTHVSEAAAMTAVAGLPALSFVDGPSVTGDEVKALPPPTTIPRETIWAIADKLTAKNWQATKEELLTLCR